MPQKKTSNWHCKVVPPQFYIGYTVYNPINYRYYHRQTVIRGHLNQLCYLGCPMDGGGLYDAVDDPLTSFSGAINLLSKWVQPTARFSLGLSEMVSLPPAKSAKST